jgi:hypothetical protein
MTQTEYSEPTEIVTGQTIGDIEQYSYTRGRQEQAGLYDVLDTSDGDLARVQNALRINDVELDPVLKEKVTNACHILLELPVANNGLILQLTGKRDYWGLAVYDDPKLIHIMEVLRGPDIETRDDRAMGARVLALVVDAFHGVTPVREANFATQKLQQLKLLFDSKDSSESKVFIPDARITFSDSMPGAEMSSREKELIRSTRFGIVEPQPNGTERVDLFLHAAVNEALKASGRYRSELWARIKPYFTELPSLLADLERLGMYSPGGRVLDISAYEYDNDAAENGKHAWLAVRGLVINIAEEIEEFRVNVTGGLR